MNADSRVKFLAGDIAFESNEAASDRQIYFPLCGTDSQSLKSAITPYLSGDIKIDKHHYLTKPTSREDLRFPVRNFFLCFDTQHIFSLAEPAEGIESKIECGALWHQVTRVDPHHGVQVEVLNFIPVSGETVELMRVRVKNIGTKELRFTPTAVLPIFGRALANKHDHEHVTALLNRIQQLPEGVLVSPTMFFNEEGHKPTQAAFFVYGVDQAGSFPMGSFPTVESFCGAAGSWVRPEAIYKVQKPARLADDQLCGKEAVGALAFAPASLLAGQVREYFLIFGVAKDLVESRKFFGQFDSTIKFTEALTANQDYWKTKAQSVQFESANASQDGWMHWVTLQPIFRRIFGCSFLPDHDYGKGGKGWRDLWQDQLSLILIEPQQVRENLLNNFGGIRIDGTNATIIGSRPGEFIADRNAITRVWMDHGVWPFWTVLLYLQQTGDDDFLLEKTGYFRDPQQSRTFKKDDHWTAAYGSQLKDKKGKKYYGSILEHLLLQPLVQFFNVGEHNLIRLESADWNDGLDMGFARGESAGFTSFYGGNLIALADLLTAFGQRKKLKKIKIAKELLILLDTLGKKKCRYDRIKEKQDLLFKKYFAAVQPEVSGEVVDVAIRDVALDLRTKGEWILEHLRNQEWLKVVSGGEAFHWYNGYYDNRGARVEGKKNDRIWMTLTGQVFAIMSGVATQAQVPEIVRSVNQFLKDPRLGGIRLNSDFGKDHYLELGRAFGFAFGTKENGAFFSHMIVMYAYALYSRGFAREAYAVIQSIYRMAENFTRSRIYPGIPEYFDSLGQGMYHYLTGSASWLVLTQLTQSFGVRGREGDLLLAPQLVREQFDQQGKAAVHCTFAEQRIKVTYFNSKRKDFSEYSIRNVKINGQAVATKVISDRAVLLARSLIASQRQGFPVHILVELN